MSRGFSILVGLLCLTLLIGGLASANFQLPWTVIGGGGGAGTSSSYRMQGTVGEITGFSTSTNQQLCAGYWCGVGISQQPIVLPLPGYTNPPTDPDGDGLFEDLNGNGVVDYNDAVLLFWNVDWIQANEPVALFDINGNGVIDYNDAVKLFWEV